MVARANKNLCLNAYDVWITCMTVNCELTIESSEVYEYDHLTEWKYAIPTKTPILLFNYLNFFSPNL